VITAPTFFSLVRLTTVTTLQYNGTAYTPVDTWALTQSYPIRSTAPRPPCGSTRSRTPATTPRPPAAAAPSTLPAVTFHPQQLVNRVDTVTDGLGR